MDPTCFGVGAGGVPTIQKLVRSSVRPDSNNTKKTEETMEWNGGVVEIRTNNDSNGTTIHGFCGRKQCCRSVSGSPSPSPPSLAHSRPMYSVLEVEERKARTMGTGIDQDTPKRS